MTTPSRMRLLLVALVALSLVPSGAGAAEGQGTLTGTLLDPAGLPVASMWVQASVSPPLPSGFLSRSARTDAAGRYTMDLEPGTYAVAALYYDNTTVVSAITTVQVVAGQVSRQDVLLIPPQGTVSLSGIVSDPSGLPQRNASVTLKVTPDASAPFTVGVAAGPTGAYRAAYLSAGRVDATFAHPLRSLFPTPAEARVDVAPGSGSIVLAAGAQGTLDGTFSALFPTPVGAVGRQSQRDLAWLNAERAANGLPTGLVENTRWSTACQAHNDYQRINKVLDHPEDAGRPGYSDAGYWAGMHSVLHGGSSWSATRNPWDTAPIHLMQVLTPSLQTIGISDDGERVCATTWPGMDRMPVAEETISTYPGNGVVGVPPSENAAESPFVPGQFVGIPQGTIAGRELFVYRDEPTTVGPAEVKILAASLTGPAGPVEIRWIDDTSQIGSYLTGGIIIPVTPLTEQAAYQASVTVAGSDGPLTHTWSFTTGRADQGGGTPNTAKNGKPRITGFSLLRRRFVVARRLADISARRSRRGTRFRAVLSQAAQLTITVTQRRRGVLTKGSCKTLGAHRRSATRRSCTRVVTVGVIRRRAARGSNLVDFTGRLHGRALPPGAYGVAAVAANASGRSGVIRSGFTILTSGH